MAHDERSDAYLDAATAGLRDDRELQLDVRAELASHLEERRRDAEGRGLSSDDAAAEALKDLGPVPELAEELLGANRRRMRRRAWLRHAARWLLVPAAVLVAVLSLDLGRALSIQGTMGGFSGGDALHPARALFARLPSLPDLPFPGGRRHRLTPDEQLILHGDPAQADPVARQRAIWERWPEEKDFLHNYVTHLLVQRAPAADAPPEAAAEFAAEVSALQAHDPANARFDYLLAGQALRQAVDRSGEKPIIRDRAALEQGMAFLRAGLAKPEYRRHAREMLVRRLEIMGPPETLLEQVSEVAVAAGTLLPDLGSFRNLARDSVVYAEALIAEGRGAEAEPFLQAPQRLAVQLHQDSFTLIDVLVVAAVAGIGEQQVPPLYGKLGQPERAEQFRREMAALGEPVRRWKARCNAPATVAALGDRQWRDQGSVLVALLLPALGELPTPEELRPSRLVEYTVADSLLASVLSLCLLGAMVLCALHTVLVRLVAGRGAGSFLLLPDWETTLRIQFLGIVLPLLAFLACTRLLPIGGRAVNVWANAGVLVVLDLLFVVAAVGVTALVTARTVRRRCGELSVPVPPRHGRVWRALPLVWLGLAVATWLAWRVLLPRGAHGSAALGLLLAAALLALLVAGLAAAGVRQLVLRVRARGALRAHAATVTRALVPVFALALIVLNLTARPYLAWEERRLVRQDTLLRIDARSGGFTSLETRLVERLRADIATAVEGVGNAPPPVAPAP